MSYWILFYQDALILDGGTSFLQGAEPETLPRGKHYHTLPWLDGKSCYAISLTDKEKDTLIESGKGKLELVALRASYDVLPLSHYLMAGKARELIHFDETVKYCSLCGSPMKWHTDISKQCTACGREVWPSIATAIIVRITRDDEVLLVRAKNFRGNYYGLVAGFLETGETLEECVRREVKEETNLEITHIRYFGNQPWPYPSGQMIGFTAEYAGGTLRLQDEELSTAAFFRYDHLPEIPHKLSMARMLIDDWLKKYE